jgi:hypothetical protein
MSVRFEAVVKILDTYDGDDWSDEGVKNILQNLLEEELGLESVEFVSMRRLEGE